MGNVRELDNALERAVILGEGPILAPADFPSDLVGEGDEARRCRRPSSLAGPTRACAYRPGPDSAARGTSARRPAAWGWDSLRSTASLRNTNSALRVRPGRIGPMQRCARCDRIVAATRPWPAAGTAASSSAGAPPAWPRRAASRSTGPGALRLSSDSRGGSPRPAASPPPHRPPLPPPQAAAEPAPGPRRDRRPPGRLGPDPRLRQRRQAAPGAGPNRASSAGRMSSLRCFAASGIIAA